MVGLSVFRSRPRPQIDLTDRACFPSSSPACVWGVFTFWGMEFVNVTTPIWYPLCAFATAVSALGLAGLLLAKTHLMLFGRTVAGVLAATALLYLANGWGLIDVPNALVWRRVALVAELMQLAALLYVGLALMRQLSVRVEAGVWWRAHAISLMAGVLAMFTWSEDVFHLMTVESGNFVSREIMVGPLGKVTYAFVVFAMVLGLARFEQILRVTSDLERYQLKFMLIGLGGLAGYAIYQASQILVMPIWRPELSVAGSLTTLFALGLVVYGLGRARSREIRAKVYLSPKMLYGSITFIAVGLYLLTIGMIGEVIRYTGQPSSIVLGAVFVFVSLVGLLIVIYSRSARATVRQVISRHFYRSEHDYREKWIEVTEAFRVATSVEAIMDRLLDLLSRTFGSPRISIWMFSEVDGRFHQVRSTNTEPAPQPLDSSHPLIAQLMVAEKAITIDPFNDPFARETRAVLCVPIHTCGKLIAFVSLGSQLHREQYGPDDRDLLRAITHHAGVLLSHAELAEELRSAAEFEALHRVAAFCLHDLKNLTGQLSLVVQNADTHRHDRRFQESVIRTVTATVKKMMTLIYKLSLKSVEAGQPEEVDVTTLIAETLRSVNGRLGVPVKKTGERKLPVYIVREQLQQVLLNLIFNAQQAARGHGSICINTEKANGRAVITVTDNGSGIPAEQLRTLFQPFRTTKRGGFGLGLYECKRILAAFQGAIHIESEVGRGTRVRIELPLFAADSVGCGRSVTSHVVSQKRIA